MLKNSLVTLLAGLLFTAHMTPSALGKHVTHRPTFVLGYRARRCFKEMFYEGSSFELFMELVEPELMRD